MKADKDKQYKPQEIKEKPDKLQAYREPLPQEDKQKHYERRSRPPNK
nr:MAG TPA_asm: hypothetical protein [Caudoviricetes sp.]